MATNYTTDEALHQVLDSSADSESDITELEELANEDSSSYNSSSRSERTLKIKYNMKHNTTDSDDASLPREGLESPAGKVIV